MRKTIIRLRQRNFINGFLMTVMFWVWVGCESASDLPKPNILLIVTDDQGYGDVGFHGNDSIHTPNLDQLADASVEFKRFYVSPVCSPTRASLLTGRYHLATGVRWVTHREEVMRSEEVTIAELLAHKGYKTGLFGKWHNGKQYPHDPNGQGFEEFFGFTDGHINNYFDTELTHNQQKVPTQGYLPDVLTDKAIEFMVGEAPFFAMVSYNTPHSPFQVPDKYFDKYKQQGLNDKNACIYGMVENLDDNISRLLAGLQQQRIADNTIVIFMSDNGPNGYRYNANLKGIKSHVDEGGVRSPFLISYPATGWKPREINNEFAAHIDILPTLMEMLEINLPDSINIHGRSLVPILEGKPQQERHFFTHQVIRKFDTIPGAVRSQDWLLTLKHNDTSLYHLGRDPFQQADLAHQEKELTREMALSFGQWFETIQAEGQGKIKIEIGHPGIPAVEFPAQEVTVLEGAEFKGKEGWANDYITQWTDGSKAQWSFRSVGKANYEVWVALSARAEGCLQVKIGDQQLSHTLTTAAEKIKIKSPDRVPRGEVYDYRWPLVHVGDFQSVTGQNTISLTTSGLQQVEIKSVQLKLKEEKI